MAYHEVTRNHVVEELPKNIYDTKSIVNVKNDDHECFKWSVLAALHPAEYHAERLIHYKPFKDELNFTGIEFPMIKRECKSLPKRD